MYCKYCGKYLEEGEICSECKEKRAKEKDEFFDAPEFPTYRNTAAEANSAPVTGDKMYGFGKALMAAIFGVAAFILISVATSLLEITLDNLLGGILGTPSIEQVGEIISPLARNIASAVLTAVGIGLAVPAIIFGIRSCKAYAEATSRGDVKPSFTLALGIVAIVAAALSLSDGLLAALTLILLI